MRILLVFVLIAALLLTSGCMTKNCNYDINCFKEASAICSRARVNLDYGGSNVLLTLHGKSGDYCKTSLKLEKIGQEILLIYPQAKSLEDTTLNCNLPMDVGVYKQISNIPLYVDQQCSGPIKDIIKGPLGEFIVKQLKDRTVI